MSAVVTEAQVANQALGLCGQRDIIDSLLENSAEAIACRTYFATVKQSVLEELEWPWAQKRSTLALLSGVTVEGWTYVYAAPSDLLNADCIHRIESGAQGPDVSPIPFAVELNAAGNQLVIATDATTPELVYTRDIALAMWPAKAIEALAAQLAVNVALMLPVDKVLARSLAPLAAQRLSQAKAASANSLAQRPIPNAEVIRRRGYNPSR